MNRHLLAQLNADFALHQDDNRLRFVASAGGMPFIEVFNRNACATISLQGAQLLSWQPTGESDVLWLSGAAVFAPGKAIRGGIPICWPWFGSHPERPDYPAHGFARIVPWQVMATNALASGDTVIDMRLDTSQLSDDIQALWPFPSVVDYRMTIGQSLSLSLMTCNEADESIVVTQALHTYFAVYDIKQATIKGLEGLDYLDKTHGFARRTQQGDVTFAAEVDRVYLHSRAALIIDDGRRRIRVDKIGSTTTVVWNPWQAAAERMVDMDNGAYRKMVCVESANAADDVVTLDSGECHTMTTNYTLI